MLYSLARLLLPSACLFYASSEPLQIGMSITITYGYRKANPVRPQSAIITSHL